MEQFTAFAPNVEVMGTPVLAFIHAVEMLEGDPTDALEKFGLSEIDDDDWVSQQTYLHMLRYFSEHHDNALSMVAVGMAIAEQIAWPANLDSLEDALQTFEKIYQRAHRTGPAGNYRMSKIAPNHIQMTANTAYPSDLDYGLFVGIARKFTSVDTHPVVTRQQTPSRLNGDDYCIFEIVW